MPDFVIFSRNGTVYCHIDYLGGDRMEKGLDRERQRIPLSIWEESFGLDGLMKLFENEIADVQFALRKEIAG